MKLRKLHIDNYKMFKDFDISFVDENDKPLPIIVLAGVNGSGKTSLLKSIFDSNRLQGNSRVARHMGLLKNTNTNIKMKLEIYKDKNTIVKFDSSIDTELNNVPSKSIRSEEEREFYLGHIFSVYLENVCQNYNSNNQDNFFGDLKSLERMINEYINELIYEEDVKASEVYDRVKSYIKDSLETLELNIEFHSLNKYKEIILSNIKGEKFQLKDLSSGEKTLFSQIIFLYFSNIKDSVLLIDEPELSLHPSWQNKVLKIYENFAFKNNCQIIIATHSPHIIASAENKYIRFLEKDEEDNVTVINDVQAYGRDIEWVLQQMGVKNTRLPKIIKRFDEIQELINNQEFDKADKELDKLEYVIGDNDKDILALRNDLAFERMDFEEDN